MTTMTVGGRIAEALGLDPSKISADEGIHIAVSNNVVIVAVTFNHRLVDDGELKLLTELKRYKLVPVEDNESEDVA